MVQASFETLFDQLPVGAFACDSVGRITHCNQALVDFLQSSREKLIGLDVHKVRDQRIVPTIDRALAGEIAVYEGPYDATTADSHLIVEMRCHPLRRADGVTEGLIATLDDATARVREQHALREQVALIEQQSNTIRAMETPILKVWDGVLCMPVIGLVSDARATDMTEGLLETIIAERARFAIIDLTGIDTLDTTTAAHLVQLFRAVSLVGAKAVLSGMRPAVAQTVITLDVDMTRLLTSRSLYDALLYCTRALGERS